MIFPARYPRALWRPVSYAGEAPPITDVHGWILHVVVGDGSPWEMFERARRPNRRFSHLWISKSGRVEQYAGLDRASWAQAGGNRTYLSVETEGMPAEPLTDRQLDALARWHRWSGTADRLALMPGQRGIGTHSMGGAPWGGHACPGPVRAAQRTEILRRARALVASTAPGDEGPA
jgi:hypothetical protein